MSDDTRPLLTDSEAMNLHVLDEEYWRRPVEWPEDVYARVIAQREAKSDEG
jgi:hypothetical protein